MQMNAEGLALIRRFEGFRGTAYKCPAGVWTIGYGHTASAGPPAVAGGMTVSEADAERILAADVGTFADAVARMVTRDLTDNQFSALVSFAYNVGTGNLRSSSVLAAINAGDFAAVPRRLQLWVKAGGRTLPGLVSRRAAEAALFVQAESGAGEGRAAASAMAPDRGPPARRSTTIWAAMVSLLASLAALGVAPGHAAVAPAALAGAASLWVIRERLRKSRDDGI